VASFDEVVPPGQAAVLKASVHTASYKGAIGKQVTVTHDDPTQGPIQLNLSANIVGSVDVLPYPALQLMRRRRGFDTPAYLIVRKDPSEEGKLALGDLKSSVPWMKVTSRVVTKQEEPLEGLPAPIPGDVVLSVQADPTKVPSGSHVESVSFKTGLKREPTVSVPVTVYVQPAVTIQPADLILNPSDGIAGAASGAVLVSVRDDVDPKTVAVTSDSPAFAFRVDPPGALAFHIYIDWPGAGDGKKNVPTETKLHVRAGVETADLPVRVNLARVAAP
jgi:hypothetical protein